MFKVSKIYYRIRMIKIKFGAETTGSFQFFLDVICNINWFDFHFFMT